MPASRYAARDEPHHDEGNRRARRATAGHDMAVGHTVGTATDACPISESIKARYTRRNVHWTCACRRPTYHMTMR